MFATEPTSIGDYSLLILERQRFALTALFTSRGADFTIEAVVLAYRPPISLPRTTVSPVVLEELLTEIGSIASVYHKPAETFVGQGKYGADAVQRTSSM
jgi:hypothetical protein